MPRPKVRRWPSTTAQGLVRSRVTHWIGLAGVAPDENATARRWGERFEWLLIVLALWLPVQWSLESTGEVSREFTGIVAWVTWSLFLLEAVVVGLMVEQRARYFRSNWLNLLVIVVGLPALWTSHGWAAVARAARLLIMLSLLVNLGHVVRDMLSRNRLGPVLAAIVIVTTLGGAVIGHFDPSFRHPFDGIWWAWVTVTTVGYGDLVPQTAAARVFAVILMLLGVSMIALLSASLVTFFQQEEDREAAQIRRLIWIKLQHMEDDAVKRAEHNDALLARLTAIELALLQAVEDRAALERRIEQLLSARPHPDAPQATESNAPQDRSR